MKSEWKWLENKDVDEAAPVELPRYAPSCLLYSKFDKIALFKMCEMTQGSVFSVLFVCLFACVKYNNSLGRIGVVLFAFLCEKLKFIS